MKACLAVFAALQMTLQLQTANAGRLQLRQDETTSAPGDAKSTAAMTKSPTQSTEAPNSSSATSANATESSTSNASTNSSTTATNATLGNPSTHLNSTNDPHGCHLSPSKPGDSTFSPFCNPKTGSEQNISAGSMIVAWDQSLFGEKDSVTAYLLKSQDAQDTDKTHVLTNQFAASSLAPDQFGDVSFNLNSTWLNGSSSLNVTLFLYVESNTWAADNDTAYRGPSLKLIDPSPHTSPGSAQNSTSNNRYKKIGEGVGIPIGLIGFFAVLAAAVFFFWRRRKMRQGFGGGSQVFDARTGRMAGDGLGITRGHARQASFHDEPTRGVELQSRNRGLTGEDNWEWQTPVSPLGSPTGTRQSNAFRDEISRQQTGRAM